MIGTLNGSAFRRLHGALSDLQRPTPTVRRVLVASLVTGAGTTTVTDLVARTLVRHRGGRVLWTSPASGFNLESFPAPTAVQRTALPTEFTDNVRPWYGAWLGEDGTDDRWFDVHLTDVGVIGSVQGTLDLVSGYHSVCLVSTFEREFGEQSLALADALSEHPQGVPSVVAFVNRHRSSSPWPRLISERHPRAAGCLPFDGAVASNKTSNFSSRTTTGLIALAGDLMVAGSELRR